MNLLNVVGLGPGDPELITMKGYKMLLSADIIFYPETSLKMAENILKFYSIDQKKLFPLNFNINSMESKTDFKKYASMISEKLKDGFNVVYAVEGEPMLYSTFLDIVPYIDFNFTVIPGISSVNGGSAELKISLATKNEPLLILPAINDYNYMKRMIDSFRNVAIIKVKKAKNTLKRILSEGRYNYYIIGNVTGENQKIYRDMDEVQDYMVILFIFH